MALTAAVHDSLPYIDTEPTPSERAAAQALIDAELPSIPSNTHPSLPDLPESHFTPLFEQELLRVSTSQPLSAIDLSRYESAPTSTPTAEDLARARTAHAYLRLREADMHLLERFGKNSWLVGNAQTEDVLRGVERELAERKAEIDGVVVERQGVQEAVAGEVRGLQEAWRGGVGRVLETEVAAEGVRREVLERRRMGAS